MIKYIGIVLTAVTAGVLLAITPLLAAAVQCWIDWIRQINRDAAEATQQRRERIDQGGAEAAGLERRFVEALLNRFTFGLARRRRH